MNEDILLKQWSKREKAIVMQLLTAVLWSFGGPLIKLVDLPPIAIAGIRSFIAAIIIYIFMDKSDFKMNWNKCFGAVAYASMVILFVSATKSTTAANAIVLQYSSPIYIAIFGGWLLNEKAKLKDWITILFVIAGMVLFFIDDIGGGSTKGNILAVLSGVALAFNTIFMRRQKNSDPLENVFWGSVLTVVVSIPFVFQKAPSPKGWVGLLFLGVFQLGFSYVIYSRAIKSITALESTFLSLVEPILNPIWVFLAVGELPGALSLLGGIIVLASIVVSCIKPKEINSTDLVNKKAV